MCSSVFLIIISHHFSSVCILTAKAENSLKRLFQADFRNTCYDNAIENSRPTGRKVWSFMAKVQSVFERYEKKYLLSLAQYKTLRSALEAWMQPDEHGLHTISNIYYDTDDYRLIRASIAKPVYKEKLRLRSYGVPTADDTVFLELKKKFDGVVFKRRAAMPLSQAAQYLQTGQRPRDEQILREIDWFLQSYPLSPKVFICYDRIALFGRNDHELRVTFDTNIRCRQTMLALDKGTWGAPLLPDGQVLMEIKIHDAMPLWMAELLSTLCIYPCSFSKYGNCYTKMLLPDILTNGGMICA